MLVILSFQDLKNYHVDALLFIITNMLIGIRGYILQETTTIILIIVLLLTFFYIFKTEKIAYADIFLIFLCITNISLEKISSFLLILSTSSILFCAFKRTKVIPLIPFITLAFYLTSL